jgi:hypothetical protein
MKYRMVHETNYLGQGERWSIERYCHGNWFYYTGLSRNEESTKKGV